MKIAVGTTTERAISLVYSFWVIPVHDWFGSVCVCVVSIQYHLDYLVPEAGRITNNRIDKPCFDPPALLINSSAIWLSAR